MAPPSMYIFLTANASLKCNALRYAEKERSDIPTFFCLVIERELYHRFLHMHAQVIVSKGPPRPSLENFGHEDAIEPRHAVQRTVSFCRQLTVQPAYIYDMQT